VEGEDKRGRGRGRGRTRGGVLVGALMRLLGGGKSGLFELGACFLFFVA